LRDQRNPPSPRKSARPPPISTSTSMGVSNAICATPTISGDSFRTIVTSQANVTVWMPKPRNHEPVPSRYARSGFNQEPPWNRAFYRNDGMMLKANGQGMGARRSGTRRACQRKAWS
jgi:hypothetical protein